jgi:hypothetical protein
MKEIDEQITTCVDLKNQSTVKTFFDLVESHSYKGEGKGSDICTNFVFFVGAGFSRAWGENFPEGKKLFENFSNKEPLFWEYIVRYLQTMSWCKLEEFYKDEFKIDFDDFKKIVFSLDMYEKHRELRPKYIDSNGLKMLREKFSALIALKMREYNPYSKELNSLYDTILNLPEEPTEKQKKIIRFFNILRDRKNIYERSQEGIRVNHITTNYDSIIEYIYINDGVNKYDRSNLNYVYRGFTPNEYSGFSDIPMIKDDWLTESLFKLNGGLEIYCNPDGTYRVDYRKKECEDLQKESPLLILPSYEQDYSSPYFIEILQKSKELLTIAKVLIIVGYSLPEEDILIRFLLKHFALDETDFQDKTIFYIDKEKSHDELEKKLKRVFREAISESFSKRVHTFSGSFNEFVEQFNKLWPDIENT